MSVRPSVCPSAVRMEQLGYYWVDSHEIRYVSGFRKSVEAIQILLKSGKHKGYFTWRPVNIYDIALSSSYNEKSFTQKLYSKPKHTFCVPPPRISCRLWNNVEKHDTARQATDDNIIQRMRFACCINKATDTHLVYVILIAVRQQW